MNRRFVARPVPEHDKLWFLVIGGPDIDIQHTLTDPEHLLEHMRRISRHEDIGLIKIRTLAEWRYVMSFTCQ